MTSAPCSHPARVAVLLGLGVFFIGGSLWAAEPKQPGALDEKAFARPELTLTTSHVPLEKVMTALPNRAAWEQLLGSAGAGTGSPGQQPLRVHIDPRSGAATNVMGAFPLVPGRGDGNRLTLASLSGSLGRAVDRLDRQAVGEAFRRFAQSHRAILNIDVQQLGEVRATQVSPEVWQIHVPQEYNGVRVRDARLAGSINNGNLVVVGTEVWGDVKNLDVTPSVGAEQALEAGFTYADGRSESDEIVREPTLEIVPVAPPEQQSGEAFVGPVGSGYGHRLVWTFVFRRAPDQSSWEVMVDAHSGEVIAFQDINQYGDVKGGVYPLTNTEQCPDPERCGTMQPQCPMPFANTGLPAPNNFTSSAGIYDSAAGNAVTTLSGRYIKVVDTCGAISVGSGSPTVDMGGTNGQHDCTSAGASPGNTSSSRSSFYELNRIAEMARGWLPSNTWLQSQLTANVNIIDTCNAFYDFSTVNFFRSGGGCRNTGEIAAIFDHEWGHALDDNDAGGVLSNSSEAYADIAAIYRLNASCVGYGFFQTRSSSCGQTADGTGQNANESQTGSHCDLDCSGVRDADWDKHADHQPDTALGFVCNQCISGSGPCGRQVHCAAAPARQAAWDLVARDLQAAPFNLDPQTALIIGNRLFYQGSGNIGLWHACSCGVSSSGCGATNGYMQWLTADDDNGNLADGTPHMTAIYNAFNRHGIACSTPAPQNSGCSGAPTEAPSLTATSGIGENQLSWTTVDGATKYWVLRSEGHAGCDFGKTRIAEVTGTSFTDTEVAIGREYSYNVMAVGSSPACFSPASACVSATPAAGPEFMISCSPSSLSFPTGGGSRTSACTVTSLVGFAGEVALDCTNLPEGASCGYAPASVTLPANGSATSTLTVTTTASTPPGTQSVKARGVSGTLTRTFGMTLAVPVPDFTLSCSPSTLSISPGGTGSGTCTVSSVNGFATPVDLSCTALPAGVTCGYSPNPVTPPADGSVASVLTVGVSPTTVAGTYTIQARAVGGALTRTFSMTLRIPDFTLACSPSSLTMPHGGGSRTSACTVTSRLAFASEVTLDCTNLPAGASCSYAPAAVTPPANGTATSTLTVTTTAATPPGTYSFMARGASGSFTRTFNMTLAVPVPDFSLACSPSTLTIPTGSTGSGTCTVNSLNGFSSAVSLSCINLPAGVSCAYDPSPVTPPVGGSATSALTVAVSPTTLPGSYSIQANAVAGTLVRAFVINLRIPDFRLTCGPSSLTMPHGGGSSTSTCTVTSLRDFAGEVALDCTNLPAGASCSYAPVSVTPPPNGTATSTLTVTTTAATPPGTHSFQARGVSGSLTRTFGMTLAVPVPDFSLACSPGSLTIPLGGTGSSTCTVSSLNGFSSAASLSCLNLPAGVSCAYDPSPVTPPAGGSATSALTVAVAPGTLPGIWTIQARADSGALSRTFNVTLRIPDYTLTCSPSSLTFPAGGGSRSSTCTVTSLRDFASEVALDCTNLPAGASCSYAPAAVTPPPNGTAASTLTVTTTAATPPGTYSFTARGVSGSRTRTAGMTLVVPVLPDFTLTCNPGTLAVPGGGSDTSTCALNPVGGFSSAVSLSCADLPIGVTCAHAPNPVTPPGTSTLTVAVGGNTPVGTYTFKVQGTGGSITKFVPMTLHVVKGVAAAFDPTLRAPKCGTVSNLCDSGTLLVGRDGKGPEPNQPNTIGASCADGTSGTFHLDESNDRITVSTLDGGTFAAGKTVKIEARVWVYSATSNKLDLYSAADATSPNWIPIATITPAAGGAQTLSATYALPVGALQAVRARFRFSGSASSCLTGSFDDHDDLVFAVNRPPVAQVGGPYSGRPNQPIAFDGTASSDADGDPLTYAWDFGDGTSGTGPTPTHIYTLPGGHTVTLVVSDGTESSPPATTTVDIMNQAPVAHAGGPYSGVRNQPIAFDGTASSDGDGDPLTYAWDFGDGTSGTGPTPTHAYTVQGGHTVTLVVSDGMESSPPATTTVDIMNQAPVAHAGGPYSGVRDQPIAFDGTASSDADGDPLTYAWDFGDGTGGTGPAPTHAYTFLGGHTVTLVVSDGMDSSAPATATVTISNLPPVVELASPGQGALFHAPADILLGAMAADPDGTITRVEFFQGTTKIGESLAPPYSFPWTGVPAGAYVLTARATDESGTSTTSAPVTILVNAPPSVSLTAPASGSVYPAPASVSLTASASDLDGVVSQVEFFQGSTSLGVVSTSPYTFTWSNVPAGQYSLSARATDNQGAVTGSAPVTITVEAHLGPAADAYVRDGSSNVNRNFGSATSLTVKTGSSGVNRWTYLKFDTSGLASVGSAKLRLFGRLSATTSTTVVTSAFPSATTTWGEGLITWNNRPAAATTALASVTMNNTSTASRWYEWDVTAYLQQEKAAGRHIVTLVLKNAAGSSPYDTFSSKEATSNRPELVLVP